MRLSEVLLFLSALVPTLALLGGVHPYSRLFRLLCGILLLTLCFQFYFTGGYWQILPAILVAGTLTIISVFPISFSTAMSRVTGVLCLLLLASSVIFVLILPLLRLPAPTGESAVGTRLLHLVDTSRDDSAFKSGKRELMVQVWYPTEARRGTLAKYRRRIETTLLSSYMAALKTHSYIDAGVSGRGAPHPLLLLNPAWQGQRTQYTFMAEQLASHGFVVAAIDHTHNSMPVAFPDGQVFGVKDPDGAFDLDTKTSLSDIPLYNIELDRQTADDIFVLDELGRDNQVVLNPFYQKIDLHRVGVLGHSFGGAVAVQTAFRDPRIRAALNMDGWNFGDLANFALEKPVMFLYEQGAPATYMFRAAHDTPRQNVPLDGWDAANVSHTLTEYGGFMVSIRGAKHMNFSDRALYSPIRRLTEAGPISPLLAHRIANEYALAFFSEKLNGSKEPLLHQSVSPFREVTIQEWKPVQSRR